MRLLSCHESNSITETKNEPPSHGEIIHSFGFSHGTHLGRFCFEVTWTRYAQDAKKLWRGERMNNDKVMAFVVGVCMCIAVAMICLCVIKPKQQEELFKEGVKQGCMMTIYVANRGMTNIPIDQVVNEAWKIRQGQKK